MKSYKEYAPILLGSSDIASLTVRSGEDVIGLKFGSDGYYKAYLVDAEAEIGGHYRKVLELKGWVWIYDDEERVFRARADEIIIYRAGEMGMIIQLINGFAISK